MLVLFQLVFSSIGLYGFGFATEDVARYGFVIPDVFFAFVIIGMVMGAVASALYIVDAHRRFFSFFSFSFSPPPLPTCNQYMFLI